MAERFDVGVVGAGYVGLVTGACMAHIGHTVTCVDKNEGRIENLKRGKLPIYEPQLGEMIARNRKRIRFSTELHPLVREADIVFIAVDTPPGDDGAADLSNVAAVARGIGRSLSEVERERPLIVVNKSTVPVGSGDYVSMLIQEGAEEGPNGEVSYRVVSNPEFLREGSAVYDSLFPDRIVLGAEDREALHTMRELYRPIIEQSFATELDPRPTVAVPFVTTDLASAEMIKYAANAFLATKISFANEIANICERVGADVKSVTAGIGLDHRIGPRFLDAGIGWGGSCFPKDVRALMATAREHEYEPAILAAAVSVNERQRRLVITKLQRDLHTLKGKRVALLGLSFKPNTDDLREAPSLSIARILESRGARVVGYDPVAGKRAAALMPEMKVVFDPYEALKGANAAVLVTEWEELRNLDLERAATLMARPRLLVDGRNAIEPAAARAAGLIYQGFGRE
ncbi:UDP-glucose/GDP-mannose dehydrogenase family protein [Rubrobacter taiwanensis]|uniref:UDP-glucose 6-dehydrogenase n=1 Tax=Rubrobacter taiwanensis TaxID=185139 RepID=A0A4R1BDX9_9ACTN|nr:UDP-glucose/GDP-mannose dehydrogenase family protein [Rubrobacter taiwanensis]TCJ15257.1 UDP-glucose/GDP-mannose dehydrogenase family protein [Rubrobacter taiwanensis]